MISKEEVFQDDQGPEVKGEKKKPDGLTSALSSGLTIAELSLPSPGRPFRPEMTRNAGSEGILVTGGLVRDTTDILGFGFEGVFLSLSFGEDVDGSDERVRLV